MENRLVGYPVFAIFVTSVNDFFQSTFAVHRSPFTVRRSRTRGAGKDLEKLYPKFLRHAITSFQSPDVLRMLADL